MQRVSPIPPSAPGRHTMKRPAPIPAAVQAAKLHAPEVALAEAQLAETRPALRGDLKARGLAAADVALAIWLAEPELRNTDGVEQLAAYILQQGQEMLDSIDRHGLDNPPRGEGDL